MSWCPRLRGVVLLVALALLAPSGLLAQVLGEIKGLVTADNGAAIPGVSVVVKNTETGAQRTAVTDEAGIFSMKSLPPGPYNVTASLEGMQPKSSDVTLLVGQMLTARPRDGCRGHRRGDHRGRRDPAGRDQRAPPRPATSPRTRSRTSRFQGATSRSSRSCSRRWSTTRRAASSRWPASAASTRACASTAPPPRTPSSATPTAARPAENDGLIVAQESIQEFQVVQNGFNPEYGLDGGGFINVVTKSGTNQYRGSAFYYYTDDGLAEDMPATPLAKFRNPSAADIEPNEFERENYGITAGGPFVRDKMHWFLSWDETDRNSPFVDNLTTRGAFDAVLQRALTEPEFAEPADRLHPQQRRHRRARPGQRAHRDRPLQPRHREPHPSRQGRLLSHAVAPGVAALQLHRVRAHQHLPRRGVAQARRTPTPSSAPGCGSTARAA